MAELVTYAFASLDPTSVASGLSAVGSMASNLGGTFDVSSTADWPTKPVLRASASSGITSAELALANDKYFTTPTYTADEGKNLNLTSLAFKAARGGSSTPRGIVVRASIDGGAYGSDLYNADLTAEIPDWQDISIDLSSVQYQGVASITFRFWVYTPNNTTVVGFDNLVLNGTVSDEAGTKPFSQAIII